MKTLSWFYRLTLMGVLLLCLQACDLTQFQQKTLSDTPGAAESTAPSASPELPQAQVSNASSMPSESPSETPTASPSAEEAQAAGNFLLKGQVLSRSQPVNRALITLEPGSRQTWTYNQGDFQFSDLPAGDYTVHVDGEGYLSSQLKAQVPVDQDKPLSVELFPALKAILLSPELPRIFIGQPLAMEGHATFQDGSSSRNLKWQITDPSIAQVDAAGVITGLKPGKTRLKVATLTSETWQKEIPVEVVRYVFDLIGPGRTTLKSRVRIVADPPADALFEGARFTWKALPVERVKLTPHPAVPNIVIVEALGTGDVEIQAVLEKDDLRLESKKINLSIEN